MSDAEFSALRGPGSINKTKQSIMSSSSNSSFGHFWKKENIELIIKRAADLDTQKKDA